MPTPHKFSLTHLDRDGNRRLTVKSPRALHDTAQAAMAFAKTLSPALLSHFAPEAELKVVPIPVDENGEAIGSIFNTGRNALSGPPIA